MARDSIVARMKAAYEKPKKDKYSSPSGPKDNAKSTISNSKAISAKKAEVPSKTSSTKNKGGFLWRAGRKNNQGSLLRASIKKDEPTEMIIEEVIEEIVDEEVIEVVIEEVIEEVIDEYEEIEVDAQENIRGLNAFRTVGMSRRALFSKKSDDLSSIQQSFRDFRDMHKSRRAAMIDLKSTRNMATSIRVIDVQEEIVVEEEEEDEEWEEQVIEKWFRRDALPDYLTTACRELIPIVYKGQDVNPEVMMRRTPLPELYKYLRQHLDYKQMKTMDNLTKFEEMFAASDEENDEEKTVEIDLNQMLNSRAAKVSPNKKSTAPSNSNLSNEAKFENLLRQVHHEEEEEEEESEVEEEEYYEEEEITPGDSRKMNNLALFDKMAGDYEEEVL